MEISKIRAGFKKKETKRLGRGTGSGQGKTAGRGNKGAGQRKGKKLPYAGFRGGNLPYYRVIPKRGFNSPNRQEYQIVNLGDIAERMKNAKEVDITGLVQANLIKSDKRPVKILSKVKDKFSLKVLVKADKFSAAAREMIEAAGGKIEVVKRKDV